MGKKETQNLCYRPKGHVAIRFTAVLEYKAGPSKIKIRASSWHKCQWALCHDPNDEAWILISMIKLKETDNKSFPTIVLVLFLSQVLNLVPVYDGLFEKMGYFKTAIYYWKRLLWPTLQYTIFWAWRDESIIAHSSLTAQNYSCGRLSRFWLWSMFFPAVCTLICMLN